MLQEFNCLSFCFLTVVAKQRLSGTFRFWAGGLSAAPTGKTDATTSAAVALAFQGRLAPIYTALKPQKG